MISYIWLNECPFSIRCWAKLDLLFPCLKSLKCSCVRHLSVSWASPFQSICPHPTSWRSVLILSIHLRLGLPSGLFPYGFPTITLYTPLSSPIRATCPAHLILLDFITHTILGEEYKSFSSSLCSLLQSPVTSSLLGPNILLNTMFLNTLSFRSSLNVSDQVSHLYKTTGKIIVPYILIFKFLDSKKYINLKLNFYHMWYLVVILSQHILNIHMPQFTGLSSITLYKQCLIFSIAQKFRYP